jgi:capsular polysaccharide biosynthesis protein
VLGTSNGAPRSEPPAPAGAAPPTDPPSELKSGSWSEEEARLTVSSAIRDNWVVFLLPIVVLVCAAVVAGLLRSPTYSAETRLAVGGLDASSPASNSDFAAAASTLAQTYGRSIQGDAVVNAVARQTGSSPEAVRAHISAFTVPSTPLLSVTATASSPGTAIALANLASRALSTAADRATRDIASPLLDQYKAAEIGRQRAEQEVELLESSGGEEELLGARARLAIAQTRAASAREAFIAGEQRQQSLAVPIQVIERANSASSDRFSVLQLWLFVAIVLGLIVGTALALFRESRFLGYLST